MAKLWYRTIEPTYGLVVEIRVQAPTRTGMGEDDTTFFGQVRGRMVTPREVNGTYGPTPFTRFILTQNGKVRFSDCSFHTAGIVASRLLADVFFTDASNAVLTNVTKD